MFTQQFNVIFKKKSNIKKNYQEYEKFFLIILKLKNEYTYISNQKIFEKILK